MVIGWVLAGITAFVIAVPVMRWLFQRRHHGPSSQAMLYAMISCTVMYCGNTTIAWILGQPVGIAAWSATTMVLALGTGHLAYRNHQRRRRGRERAATDQRVLVLLTRMHRRQRGR